MLPHVPIHTTYASHVYMFQYSLKQSSSSPKQSVGKKKSPSASSTAASVCPPSPDKEHDLHVDLLLEEHIRMASIILDNTSFFPATTKMVSMVLPYSQGVDKCKRCILKWSPHTSEPCFARGTSSIGFCHEMSELLALPYALPVRKDADRPCRELVHPPIEGDGFIGLTIYVGKECCAN